ncbi:hypothetical protein P3T23_009272 [Paraburkholderia sp. GAS448]|uniref:TcpQ domain-containing protein n=1 Tax=Paraburkholderia sp. GAS448 TaxID=3035136 RepID=UPI003D1A7EBA
MRIRVAAMAIGTLVFAGASSMAWAADDSSALVVAGWQPLKGSDVAAAGAGTASTPAAAAAAPHVASGATQSAAPQKAAEPASKPAEVWIIREGFPIGEELKAWGSRANWNVVWRMPRDVIAPTTTSFTGDFPSAATDVVKTLAANGALIRAQIFDGNRTVVVQGPGVAPQQ